MRYTKIAKSKPFEGAPVITNPACFGASPRKPLILRINALGERPMHFSVRNLPKGLELSENVISGQVKRSGNYPVTLVAENALGTSEKTVTLEIRKDTVLLTPLMGFTSWNAFAFEGLTQEKMEQAARQMLQTGLCEYGYNYVNIDSGWQGAYGGPYDAIQPNEKFPDMKGFCDRMHGKGLKCGIYSTPMLNAFGCSMQRKPLPPGCTQGAPDDRFADERGGIGVIRKEKNNALQWADWGFDYLKYDWRPSDPVNAELMRRELVKTGRDFGFCVSVRARAEYHKYWEKYCSSYRCNTDSVGNFQNLLEIYRTYFDFIEYVNRGHYFDLDMLDIGESDLFEFLEYTKQDNFGYTEDEELMVYSARAFFASPIQLSCHLETLSEFEFSMCTNEEVIAINQDELGKPARPLRMLEQDGTILHVWRRELANGYAVAAFNFGSTLENVTIDLDGCSRIRDVWAKEDMGEADRIVLQMPPHTVRIFRIRP